MKDKEIGIINKIKIFNKKNSSAEIVEMADCTLDRGLHNDKSYNDEKKAISLVDNSVLIWMEKQEIEGLCFCRFKSNILTQGFDTINLAIGDKIVMGNAYFEVTAKKNSCFKECKLVQQNKDCLLSKTVIYIKAKTNGQIYAGDIVRAI